MKPNRPFSALGPATPKGNPGKPNPPGQGKLPPRRAWLLFLIVLFGNYLVMRVFFPDADAPVTVPYTVFKEEAAKGAPPPPSPPPCRPLSIRAWSNS
jgi:hypothetical protein